MRFKVHIEYEGTKYNGWQLQKGQPTIQGELIKAATKVFKTENLEFYGAGRTDAGVHAVGQVAHLEVQTTLITDHIRQKMNEELPADINILKVEKAEADFHARHDAKARSYIYQISKRRTALGRKYAWWIGEKLDIKKMKEAATLFAGMHDFQSFADDTPEEKSTKVSLSFVDIYEEGGVITIHVVGSHFLWKMVRRMVGVLVEVGKGKLETSQVSQFLKTKSAEPARMTAPAIGLFLERIYYGEERIKREPKKLILI
jgi:tRNA pseudouridine38-40 synthase